MTIVNYKPEQLWDWLNDHKCEAVDISDESLDNQVIIYQGPTGKIVPIQILKVYWPFYVCKVCEALEIDVPNRFERYYEQLAELRKIQAESLKAYEEKKKESAAARPPSPPPTEN